MHVDLGSFMENRSIEGYKYNFLFVDGYSEIAFFYKGKSEVLKYFKEFQSITERESCKFQVQITKDNSAIKNLRRT